MIGPSRGEPIAPPDQKVLQNHTMGVVGAVYDRALFLK
jgi:hypothetical protein